MQPKSKPYYTWVTHLAEILAYDKNCHYAKALMTQYKVKKKPSNYDSSEHDEMVLERARQLQAEGYKVYVEKQNSFTYCGGNYDICVGGRPDILPIKDNQFLVEDCKSGREKESHKMQLLIYMLLLPCAPETKAFYQGKIPNGRIIYKHKPPVEISAYEVTPEFKQKLQTVIEILYNQTLPKPRPNKWECHYCPISKSDCPAYDSGEIG